MQIFVVICQAAVIFLMYWALYRWSERRRRQPPATRGSRVYVGKRRKPQPPRASGESRMVRSGGMTYIRKGPPRNPPRPKPKSPWVNPRPPKKPTVPAHLARDLMALTRDQSTANRLVSDVARKNPGRSPAWCAEKAIADLERDRRR